MGMIFLRIEAGIPVVIMGETGCGKTSLIEALALSSGAKCFKCDRPTNTHGLSDRSLHRPPFFRGRQTTDGPLRRLYSGSKTSMLE